MFTCNTILVLILLYTTLGTHGAPAKTPQWLIEVNATDNDAKQNVFNWYQSRGMKNPESKAQAINFGSDIAILSLPSGGDEEARKSLEQVTNVKAVLPQVKYSISGSQINAAPGLDALDGTLDGVFNFPDNAQGQGVDVYVLDTGVDVNHAQFDNRATIVDLTGEGNFDLNGHGTHVSGTVAGTTTGIAKQANIIGIKVFDSTGSGSNAVIIQALETVAQMAAERGRPSVINMSLGGQRNQGDVITQRIVQVLTQRGIAVVVAAGNETQDACNVSPSFIPEAISVAAVDPRNNEIASFSNFGQCADIFAPGVRTLSARTNSGNGLSLLSGTSMASPHVAGVMAALMSTGLTNTQALQQVLQQSEKNVVRGDLRGTPNSLLKLNA